MKERFATYEERRDYFEQLVTERLVVTVWLVGAGPGDPGLITAKGLDLVRCCDALVYDVLVAPELVDEAPDDALVIPREDVRQAELNTLLVELGRQGLEVVRLKGGDPFVFGRGGEEAEALAAAGVAVRGRARRLGDVGRARIGRDPGHAPRRLGAGDARLRALRLGRGPRLRPARGDAGNARRLHGPRPSRRRSQAA